MTEPEALDREAVVQFFRDRGLPEQEAQFAADIELGISDGDIIDEPGEESAGVPPPA
jgi:hypothetical protein